VPEEALGVSRVAARLGGTLVVTDDGLLVEGSGRAGDIVVVTRAGARYRVVGSAGASEHGDVGGGALPQGPTKREKDLMLSQSQPDTQLDVRPVRLVMAPVVDSVEVAAGEVVVERFRNIYYDPPEHDPYPPGAPPFIYTLADNKSCLVVAQKPHPDNVSQCLTGSFCARVMDLYSHQATTELLKDTLWRLYGNGSYQPYYEAVNYDRFARMYYFHIYFFAVEVTAEWELFVKKWNGGRFGGSRYARTEGAVEGLLRAGLAAGSGTQAVFGLPETMKASEYHPQARTGIYYRMPQRDMYGRWSEGVCDGVAAEFRESDTSVHYVGKKESLRFTKIVNDWFCGWVGVSQWLCERAAPGYSSLRVYL
jgi:hypothetical protein